MPKKSTLKLYRSYNFIDKDPVIDLVRTVVDDSKMSYTRLNVESGVSVGTIRNWFFGQTKRPQFATIAAIVRACGEDMFVGNRRVRARPGHLKVIPGLKAARTARKRRA